MGADEVQMQDGKLVVGFTLRKSREWRLEVRLNSWPMTRLPSLFWLDAEWGWPHVGANGDVCVTDHEGISFDPDDIERVIPWLVDRGLSILEDDFGMSSADRLKDFSDELESYLSLAGAKKIVIDSDPDEMPTEMYVEVEDLPAKRHPPQVVARRLTCGETRGEKGRLERIVIINVSIDAVLGLGKTWDSAWLDNLKASLSPQEREMLASSRYKGALLRVANKSGTALVFIHWGDSGRRRNVYVPERRYRSYVLARTGGAQKEQHVVVIGCGAVGSRVAELLVLGGIKKLTLIDHDTFSADNIGRHILDQAHIGKNKAVALASCLKARMPGVDINSQADRIIQTEFIGSLDATALVLATGSAPLERQIVRTAFSQNWPGLIVSTFVEAYGLGGHAIAMRAGNRGCLECLYFDPEDGAKRVSISTSLLADGQTISKRLFGCAAFTPYSAIDAIKTAMLAVECIYLNEPQYKRWVGSDIHAKADFIQPSALHDRLLAGLVPTTLLPSSYKHASCPCCS